MKPIGFVLIVLALAASATPARGQCQNPEPNDDPLVAGQLTVRVADYSDVESALALLHTRWPTLALLDAIESRQTYLLSAPDGQECDAEHDILQHFVNPDPSIPDVDRPLIWVEGNYEAQPGEGKTGSIYIGTGGGSQAHAAFVAQYAADMLGITEAQLHATGAGVAVAVLDTGIDPTHPALAGRVQSGIRFVGWSAGSTVDSGNGQDDDGDGLIDEMVGHGTFVSGLISLVAPDAQLIPVVVLNSDGVGNAWTIANGMYYAIDRSADVINMSLGSTYNARVIEDAAEEAAARGIIVVAAGGNLNQDIEEYPAARDTIGVAAVDAEDRKATFSNYNDRLFICAPGVSAPGESGGADPALSILGPVPGDEYAAWEGTSFSTAFVSGAVALIRSQNPHWHVSPPGQQCPGEGVPDDIVEAYEQVLACSSVNIDDQNPQYSGMLGVGRLDIAAAVAESGPAPILGDLDGVPGVGLGDLTILLQAYGLRDSPADLDADGHVGLSDLSILLTNFGQGG